MCDAEKWCVCSSRYWNVEKHIPKMLLGGFYCDWNRSDGIFMREVPPSKTEERITEVSPPCAQMTKHETSLSVIILNFTSQVPAQPWELGGIPTMISRIFWVLRNPLPMQRVLHWAEQKGDCFFFWLPNLRWALQAHCCWFFGVFLLVFFNCGMINVTFACSAGKNLL